MDTASVCDWELASAGEPLRALTVHQHRKTFVLPWHTFLFATGADDCIEAVFHSHTVEIQGSGLASLLVDIADQRVRLITQPDRTAKFRTQIGPLITAISVAPNE